MTRFHLLIPLAIAVSLAACSGAGQVKQAATAAVTAPAAQTTVIGTASPLPSLRTPAAGTPAVVAPLTPSLDVVALLQQVELQSGDLPSGFSVGQLEGYQNNQAAASGFDNYDAVVKLMDSTGRAGGLVQGLNVSGGGSAGDSIDVWKDAQGCAQYFDQYPRPTTDVTFTQVSLPHPVGDQSLALRLQQNGQTGYSISWRRGRLILGVGEFFPGGQDSLAKVMTLVDALDAKAAKARQ